MISRLAVLAGGLLALALTAAATVPSARAAGIDCAKAATPVERMLCADLGLRQGDADLAEAFAAARDAAPDPGAVRASQREWLKRRNACPDAPCLAEAQAGRKAELEALVATGLAQAKTQRERLRVRLGWPEDCEASFQDLVSPDGGDRKTLGTGVESYPLGDGRTLHCVLCDQAAYQSVYVVVIQDKADGPGRLLRFPLYDTDGGKVVRSEDSQLAGALDFTPRTGELTVFAKARGLGDCGSFVRYAFPAAGSSPVTVVEARVKECSQRLPKDAIIDPGTWPLVKKP